MGYRDDLEINRRFQKGEDVFIRIIMGRHKYSIGKLLPRSDKYTDYQYTIEDNRKYSISSYDFEISEETQARRIRVDDLPIPVVLDVTGERVEIGKIVMAATSHNYAKIGKVTKINGDGVINCQSLLENIKDFKINRNFKGARYENVILLTDDLRDRLMLMKLSRI
jgi:hypothetical protein